MLRVFAVAALAAAMVGHPIVACAHGVGSREMDPGAARAMEFLYADGEPMAFAQVQVTAPGGSVHQSARTDARGRFAFVPDGPGQWSVAASDGQGHRAVAAVAVAAQGPALDTGPATDSGSAPATGPGAAPEGRSATGVGPGPVQVALGLSLLANLFLLAALFKRRRAAPAGRR
ncbi:MAG: carboxypeptidase regulatory-like domain-containing protein [Solidesulfovibrio sp. DCME]|uniref:carboxypeptidase regulatory-like domain-containing protein n=1 Tax=Solidesulfovibrio sp. DCME TaxID=3447380 RepID=UPI003D0BE61F